MFLRLIPSSPQKEQFWKKHRESASALGAIKKQGAFSKELLARLEHATFTA
jgi:hypothetical protein